jgi:hypothetical protein
VSNEKGIYIIFDAHASDTLTDLRMKRQWLEWLAAERLHPATRAQLDNVLASLDRAIASVRVEEEQK